MPVVIALAGVAVVVFVAARLVLLGAGPAASTQKVRRSLLARTWPLQQQGKLQEAVAVAREALANSDLPLNDRNTAIDVLINAGHYAEALRAEPPAARELAFALIQINLAEAEYNLGEWDRALERLRPLDELCAPFPIAATGLAVQRAWIAAHQGRADEALALLEGTDILGFPDHYLAEFHFAVAAALVAANRLDDAERALDEAALCARRPSSERNLVFMRARIAAAREDWVEAERLCRESADHEYKGQGADGLLLWSKALRELGRDPEEALQLMRERDPES
jgi:tetratricopeptide (TPR) repeat protein